MLLMPLVTVSLATVIAGESVTPTLAAGGLLVLAGVYVGAFAPQLKVLQVRTRQPAHTGIRVVQSGPVQPGCA